MSISNLKIQNFRSIVYLEENMNDLNIFVGQNDDGKSNILRALDLFFNHDKNDGFTFNWVRDYCCFTQKRSRKAEEITIQIVISPPASFVNTSPVIWRKIWRREGLYKEIIKHQDGSEIRAKSKITPFLKAIRFDYVPAIKGNDYFQVLMSKLHDMLEATVKDEVRSASSSFTSIINENTKQILKEIRDRLSLETTIQLPTNLRDLFAQLEFTSVSSEKPFSLNQRGDGIKVRHIPIVLRWLAEQANFLSAPGRPKAVTIWGYEEPENNLELRRCFDLAKEFVGGASDIQAFVTTHSPAFYSVFRESDPDKVGLFLVTKDEAQRTTKIRSLTDDDLNSLDSSMGLLAMLEPHFKELNRELNRLRLAEKNLDTSKYTIFCEGPSDKNVFEEVLNLFFPTQATQVKVLCSTNNGGGHNWVSDMMIAWSYIRPIAKSVGIFDKDPDAIQTMKSLENKIKNPSSRKVFSVALKPSTDLKNCFKNHFEVPFALEELFSEDIWNFAENKGWLEDRSNPIAIYKFKEQDRKFSDYLKEALPEAHLRRLALKKVRFDKKEVFSKHVCSFKTEKDRIRVLEPVKPTMNECLKKLGLI